MEKAKTMKILRIAGNVVIWLIVAFAVVTTIFAFAARNGEEGVPTLGNKCYLTVQSDSMAPTFKKGDLLISRYLSGTEEVYDLKEHDVITFRTVIEGKPALNTHRIKTVNVLGNGSVTYVTHGDNNLEGQDETVHPGDVVAVWTGRKMGGVGKVISFLQTQLGFGLCIVLPMLLFFGYELYRFIVALIAVKNTGKKQITAADEELIKQKAVEEYLRQQAAAKGEQVEATEQPAEEAPTEKAEENKE